MTTATPDLDVVLESADGRRRTVTLGARVGPPGSQGAVRLVRGHPRLVVKLIRNPEAENFADKLEAMLASRPAQMTVRDGIVRVAWPLARVRAVGGGRLLGYVQPALTAPDFGPFHQALRGGRPLAPRRATWRWYLELALDLARTMTEIHRAGHVVSDLSPENLFATPGAAVGFVDVDGWQIHDQATGLSLPSPFSRAEYTPPEHLADPASRKLRAPSADRWALAVLLAEILRLGAHPFAGVPPDAEPPFDVQANVENRRSVLLGSTLRQPAHAPDADLVLAGPLRRLLERCFAAGYDDPDARPLPQDWVAELTRVQNTVRLCPTGELHVLAREAAACPWCELAGRTGRDPFSGADARGGSAHDPYGR